MRIGKESTAISGDNEILAHKIALRPTKEQEIYFKKAIGTARFAYNWGLTEWACQYDLSKDEVDIPPPDWMDLNARLNAIKAEDFPWMEEVTKHATEHSLAQLWVAFSNFFQGRAKYPNYHKKYCHESFYLHHNDIKLDGKRIKIPKLGWARMTKSLAV